jgi:hypothetical protein
MPEPLPCDRWSRPSSDARSRSGARGVNWLGQSRTPVRAPNHLLFVTSDGAAESPPKAADDCPPAHPARAETAGGDHPAGTDGEAPTASQPFANERSASSNAYRATCGSTSSARNRAASQSPGQYLGHQNHTRDQATNNRHGDSPSTLRSNVQRPTVGRLVVRLSTQGSAWVASRVLCA